MRAAFELLKADPRARVFFGAQIQSSFGTGAGYVAVVLVAYERFHSPWAITCVLLAEFLPAMFLGPIVGAAADRWSRKGLLVAADAVRAAAFVGLALVGSFEATVAFALLAGGGNAIFNPTVMAALPSFTGRRHMAAATSLYHSVAEVGFSAGPAIAALAFMFAGVEALMIGNAISFMISAVVLSLLRFNKSPADQEKESDSTSLLRGALDGIRAVAADRAVRSFLIVSGITVFTMGLINVGELLLARDALALDDSQFSILVAAMGGGIALGSLLGSAGGAAYTLKRNFLRGIFCCGIAAVAAGLAPSFGVAVVAFAAMGIGNGAVIAYEGVLLQTVVPDDRLGRMFGVKNALVSWCFAGSFASAGALAVTIGPRALFVLAGAGTLAACAYGSVRLRTAWAVPAPAERQPALVPAPSAA